MGALAINVVAEHAAVALPGAAMLGLGLPRLFGRGIGRGATITVLSNFAASSGSPYGGLIADGNGKLYGTTPCGGTHDKGTVFELPGDSSTISTKVSFNGSNGALPYGGLIADADGNLYGTTYAGGAFGLGTVFKLAKGSNTITTLASFNGRNGANPWGSLIADASGNFYGTTITGGAHSHGTVFELAKDSFTITTLASFNNNNGAYPEGCLITDGGGNLYGTAQCGGLCASGTVFRLAKGSDTITTLASFNGRNGAYPVAGLIADASGNLYGTTGYGGAGNAGTVFKLMKDSGTITTMANFNGRKGAYPYGRLIVDASGNLYGTTRGGGARDCGTVFKLAKDSGKVTTLASFNSINGAYPYGGLIADASGNLYGITVNGGVGGYGTIFKITGTPRGDGIPGAAFDV